MRARWLAAFALACALAQAQAASEPPLPRGLSKPVAPGDSPPLPSGLRRTDESGAPRLPPGLGAASPADEPPPVRRDTGEELEQADGSALQLSGFVEARAGLRIANDPEQKDISLGEVRAHLALVGHSDTTTLTLAADLVADGVASDTGVHLEEGDGIVDLREANVLVRPASFVDAKLGRQILTWGTGDLIFINDLFPKDFNAFLIGRDLEYLKAPSDALKVALFSDVANLDVVYTPRFDADRFIDGRRISFFNRAVGRQTGRSAVVRTVSRERWFQDDELALRLHTVAEGVELAAYAYRGFWKSPAGVEPTSGRATHPALSVYGASIRGAAGVGIGNLEFGYYRSEQDRAGTNALIRNGELRFLAGFEWEAGSDFTIGLQYLLEHMLDHDAFEASLPPGDPGADGNRHVLTARATQLLLNQDLRLSLFVFFSPSDGDAYLRPRLNYDLGDDWSTEIGANIFLGTKAHTFFGQLEDASNVFASVRYSF